MQAETIGMSQERVLLFFLIATLMFIVPFLMLDLLYSDDIWRAASSEAGWTSLGRPLIDVFYHGLSLTQGAPNLFPLPLLIAVAAISLALRSLVNHYFAIPTLARCLVVLPLWYSPFFLENLSFQYDGPVMGLGIVAMIYAITYRHASWLMRIAVGSLCIAAGLSIYQMLINVYLGLCCIEVIRIAYGGDDLRGVLRCVRDSLIRLFSGVVIYWLTAYQLMDTERGRLRRLDTGWFNGLRLDLQTTLDRVALLHTPDNGWLCWALIGLSCAGMGLVFYRVGCAQASLVEKLTVSMFVLLGAVGAVIAIPGLALIFEFFDVVARVMMGLGPALVLMFFLSYEALTAMHVRLGMLLVIPALALLSFSFIYGRVLAQHQALSITVMQHVSYDLSAQPALAGVQRYELFDTRDREWVVGAKSVYRLLPALKFVNNVNYLFFPETLPQHTGITGSSWGSREDSERFYGYYKAGVPPTLRRQLYSIYREGDVAKILLITPPPDH